MWVKVMYGAMMTLALVMGSSLPSIVVGTLSRNSSSWRERTSALPSYQLPAWVASRVPDCGILWIYIYRCIYISVEDRSEMAVMVEEI